MTPEELRKRLAKLPPVELVELPAGWPAGEIFMRRPGLAECDELGADLRACASDGDKAAFRRRLLSAVLCTKDGTAVADVESIDKLAFGESLAALTTQALELTGYGAKKNSTDNSAPD